MSSTFLHTKDATAKTYDSCMKGAAGPVGVQNRDN